MKTPMVLLEAVFGLLLMTLCDAMFIVKVRTVWVFNTKFSCQPVSHSNIRGVKTGKTNHYINNFLR